MMTEEERKNNNLVIPEPYPKGKPIVKFPNLSNNCESSLKKHLTKHTWSGVKYNRTKHGGTIMNLIKLSENDSNHKIGLALTDGDCIDQFSTLLEPIIKELHQITIKQKNYNFNINTGIMPKAIYQEKLLHKFNHLRFEISRNIQDFPFPIILTREKREILAESIKHAINNGLVGDLGIKGHFHPLTTDNEDEIKVMLKEKSINIDDISDYMTNCGMDENWPEGRGVFFSDDKEIVILVNYIDHFKLTLTQSSNCDFVNIYSKAIKIIKTFESYLTFETNSNFGYLTSCPSLIGAGAELSSNFVLENIPQTKEFNEILQILGFDLHHFDNMKNSLHVSSKFKLYYLNESEFMEDFYKKISCLLFLDQDKPKIEKLTFDKIVLDETNHNLKLAYENIFEESKQSISQFGNNLNYLLQLYNEDPINNLGFIVPEKEDYYFFIKFINHFTTNYQKFDFLINDHIHKADEYKSISELSDKSKISYIKLNLIRNLDNIPFTTSKFHENSRVEALLKEEFSKQDYSECGVKQYEYSDENEEVKSLLEEHSVSLFQISEINKYFTLEDYPTNRSVVLFEKINNEDVNCIGMINDLDHLRLEYLLKDEQLTSHNLKLFLKLINEVSKNLKFAYDNKMGFLTVSPKFIGTGLLIKSELILSNLSKNGEKLKEICEKFNFYFRIDDPELGKIFIQNNVTLGKSENDLIAGFVIFINELIENDI